MTVRIDSIMLIDDEEADNYLHRRVVEQAEIAAEVLVFDRAAEALARLRDSSAGSLPPQIVFLDLNMPGMTGWDFLDEYRLLAPAARAQTSIVVLTTSANPADRERAESDPDVQSFLIKPLTPESLAAVVDHHLAR